MIDVGRVCIKLAGRDAGNLAIVVDKIDNTHVLVDGNVRRKKCNIKHLEPTGQKIDIKKKDSTGDVLSAMKKSKLEIKQKIVSKKEKKKTEKPKRKRKLSAPKPVIKEAKKAPKKETKEPVKKAEKK